MILTYVEGDLTYDIADSRAVPARTLTERRHQVFTQWLDGRLSRTGETSRRTEDDYPVLLHSLYDVADVLGLPWSKDLIPQNLPENLQHASDHHPGPLDSDPALGAPRQAIWDNNDDLTVSYTDIRGCLELILQTTTNPVQVLLSLDDAVANNAGIDDEVSLEIHSPDGVTARWALAADDRRIAQVRTILGTADNQ